jgi:hypothetical protein
VSCESVSLQNCIKNVCVYFGGGTSCGMTMMIMSSFDNFVERRD